MGTWHAESLVAEAVRLWLILLAWRELEFIPTHRESLGEKTGESNTGKFSYAACTPASVTKKANVQELLEVIN